MVNIFVRIVACLLAMTASVASACNYPSGKIFDGATHGNGSPIATTFSERNGEYQIGYIGNDHDLIYTGSVSNVSFDAVNCVATGVWIDIFGSGTAKFAFTSDGSSFDGTYELKGSAILNTWTGQAEN